MALKDMARDCADALKSQAREIVAACAAAINSNRLKSGECVRLMYPIGKMVSFLPPQDVLNELQTLLMPYLVELQGVMARQQHGAGERAQILFILKLFTTLFQSLEHSTNRRMNQDSRAEALQQHQQPKSPLSALMPQLLPLLKSVAASA